MMKTALNVMKFLNIWSRLMVMQINTVCCLKVYVPHLYILEKIEIE
jgi:hypothetical protein